MGVNQNRHSEIKWCCSQFHWEYLLVTRIRRSAHSYTIKVHGLHFNVMCMTCFCVRISDFFFVQAIESMSSALVSLLLYTSELTWHFHFQMNPTETIQFVECEFYSEINELNSDGQTELLYAENSTQFSVESMHIFLLVLHRQCRINTLLRHRLHFQRIVVSMMCMYAFGLLPLFLFGEQKVWRKEWERLRQTLHLQ